MKSLLLTAAVSLLLSQSLLASEHEHEQHSAHVHGTAQLLVAVENNSVEIELRSPAMNIIGFEHRPKTDKQHEQLNKAVAMLQDGDKLFSLPAAANCFMDKAHVESPYKDHEEQHEHEHAEKHEQHHGHEETETHSEFHATYRYTCQRPTLVKQLMVKLFLYFPLTEHIEVQSISPRGQQAAELDAHDFIMDL